MGLFSGRDRIGLQWVFLVFAFLGGTALAADVDGDGLNHVVDPNDYKHRYDLSTSAWHTCLIEDHGINCWGSNRDGASAPPSLTQPTEVAAGDDFACAIDGGQIRCWGYNSFGQATDDWPADMLMRGITAGSYHACALHADSGSPFCWGREPEGQPFLSDVLSIKAGGVHTCALNTDGLHCWGDSAAGEVPEGFEATDQFALGGVHTCAIDASGTVQCWGRNLEGQASPPPLSNPRLIAAGGNLSCAVDDSGIQCWGLAMPGTPLPPAPTLTNVYQLDVGHQHACALSDEGLTCWAPEDSSSAHMGSTVTDELFRADQVAHAEGQVCGRSEGNIFCFGYLATTIPTLTNPSLVGASLDAVCALADEGLFCWGEGSDMSLSHPSSGVSNVEVSVYVGAAIDQWTEGAYLLYWGDSYALPPYDYVPSNPTHVWVGGLGSCAHDATGLQCWRDGFSITPPVDQAEIVAINSEAMCAVSDGVPYCWTDDPTSTTNWQSITPAMTEVTELVVGDGWAGSFACALNSDGVQCWGDALPVYSIPSLTNPRNIYAGYDVACALDDTGLVCWGDEDAAPPEPMPGATQISIRQDFPHTCALGTDGIVCRSGFGYNYKQAFYNHRPTFQDSDADGMPDDTDGAPYDPLRTTPNTPPVAEAGESQVVLEGSVVDLFAGSSYDPDGEIIDWAWDLDAGDGISFEPADATGELAETTFASAGTFTVTLQVTDTSGATATDTVAVTVLADSDSDGVADDDDAFPDHASASRDDDGDNLPDNCATDQSCLDDGLTPDPSLNDFDNDGIPTDEDSDDTTDTAPPTVLAPAGISLVATGTETEVDLFQESTAYASDFPNTVLAALPDTTGNATTVNLVSGRHLIDWCATDAAGNTGCATQTVDITPLVRFSSASQITAEGVTVDVLVELSGNPVSYPVTVPLSFDIASSTAINPDDHDAAHALVTIDVDDPLDGLAANTGRYRFSTVDDGVTGESDETVVLYLVEDNGTDTLAGAALDATLAAHTVTVTEENVAPTVVLTAPAKISLGNETAAFSVAITDPNNHSDYLVSWYLDGSLIDSATNLEELVLDLDSQTEGTHTLRVTVLDTGSPAKEGEAEQEVRFVAPASAESGGTLTPLGWLAGLLLLRRRKRLTARALL